MNEEEIHREFDAAVSRINESKETFPPDFLLRLYAYYKRATQNVDSPSGAPLVEAFKANALFQSKHVTPIEAKQEYIKLVKAYYNP